jgi:hypothetical protein
MIGDLHKVLPLKFDYFYYVDEDQKSEILHWCMTNLSGEWCYYKTESALKFFPSPETEIHEKIELNGHKIIIAIANKADATLLMITWG